MKYLYCMLVAVLLSTACKKDKKDNQVTACGIENPTANIPWLKHLIDSMNTEKQLGLAVAVIRYNGEDYINVQLVSMSCWPCNLFTCTGRHLTHPADSALFSEVSRSRDVTRISVK